MTTAEWDYVSAHWYYCAQFKFRIDGYDLELHQCISKSGMISYIPYINGEFKVRWLAEECEERRRFFQKAKNALYTPRMKKELTGLISRRELNKKVDVWKMDWRSFLGFKRYVTTHNNDIELLSPRPDNDKREETHTE